MSWLTEARQFLVIPNYVAMAGSNVAIGFRMCWNKKTSFSQRHVACANRSKRLPSTQARECKLSMQQSANSGVVMSTDLINARGTLEAHTCTWVAAANFIDANTRLVGSLAPSTTQESLSITLNPFLFYFIFISMMFWIPLQWGASFPTTRKCSRRQTNFLQILRSHSQSRIAFRNPRACRYTAEA